MSSSSGHYSPYQTQPPSNPPMSAPTPPGRTPPETHSSSVGAGQLQEHSASSASTAQAATPHNGELFVKPTSVLSMKTCNRDYVLCIV